MYSVEDLLISHGYKLSRTCPPVPPPSHTAAPPSSSSAPLDNNKHRHGNLRRDMDPRPGGGGGAFNGVGTEGGAEGRAEAPGGGAIQRAEGGEMVERLQIQRRKDMPLSYLGDLQPLGDSLATDSGFYDAPSLTFSEHPEERDVSYWRRRGQDFSALLDYADPRELRLSGGLWRGGVGFAPEELRADRPVARWEEPPSWQQREPAAAAVLAAADSGPETLRVSVTGDRKCQSLGTEEWRPAVGLGRQLSDSEAERWAQEQQLQLRLRPHEGAVVPVVRQKSQSLPRVLSPEDPQYADPPSTGPPALPIAPRLNGSALYGRYPSDWASGGERWACQGQVQGQSQSQLQSQGQIQGQIQSQSHFQGHGSTAVVPKPRFSRPVKPPSYETHQQSRGSWETLSSEPAAKHRDRPLAYPQNIEPLRDRSLCLSQSSEPLRDRSLCLSQSSEPLRDRSLCLSQSSEPLRDRSLCLSQSSELLRDRSLCVSQSSEPFRDRSLCLSQSSEPLRDRSLCLSQSSEPLRDRSLCLSQSSEPLRDRSLCLSQSSEPLRDRSLCLSQSSEPLRDRPLCLSQSAEPLRDLRDRPLCLSQSAEPLRDLRDLRDRSICFSQSAEPLRDLRDRSICFSQSAEILRMDVRPDLLPHDLYGSGVEPPGYNPPPSYRRMPPHRGLISYRADAAHLRWKREPVSAEMGRWFSRQPPAITWTDHRWDDRSLALARKPLPPAPAVPARTGLVQYLPFDDLRIRHISAGASNNAVALPDPTEKMRHHANKDLPTPPAVVGQSTHDSSAFLPAQVAGGNNADAGHKPAPGDQEHAGGRWQWGAAAKPSEAVAVDQSVPKFHATFPARPPQPARIERPPEPPKRPEKLPEPPKRPDRPPELPKRPPPPIERPAEQPKRTDVSATDQQGKGPKPPPDKGSSESLSHMKRPDPPPEPPPPPPPAPPEKPKSMKRKLNETIFCLVSVPAVLAQSHADAASRDQNNNDEEKLLPADEGSPVRVPPPPPSTPSEKSNTLSSGPNQSLKSTSTTSTDLELQALTGSVSSSRMSSTRRPHHHHHRRRDSRPSKPNPHDALRRYSGAWPGDQYRDQETQTSPEPAKSAPAATAGTTAAPATTTTTTAPGPANNTEAQQPAAPTAPPAGAPGAASGAGPPGPECPPPDTGPGAGPESSSSGGGGGGGGGGSGTPFGYPMKGQKRLKPSSNSAFSRTGTFSKSTGPPAAIMPAAQGDGPTKPGPAPSEAFGQFLLKPVSRRPGDAIEELESIHKEAQEQTAGKRPSMDQCIEDLNEAYKDILELSTASNNLVTLPSLASNSLSCLSNNLVTLPSLASNSMSALGNIHHGSSMLIPDRIKAKLASSEPMVGPKPGGGSLRSAGLESWAGAVLGGDPEYREVKSAFSRPSTGKSVSFSKHLREEICAAGPSTSSCSETGFRDYRSVVSALSQRRSMDGRTVNLDFPPSKDSPPKDEAPSTSTQQQPPPVAGPSGLAAAEVPWADRQPMQDASTLTSPPDYEHICQSLQQGRDPAQGPPVVKPKVPGGGGGGGGAEGPVGPAGGAVAREECCYCQMEVERLRLEQMAAATVARDDQGSGFAVVTVGQGGRFLGGEGEVMAVPPDWKRQLSLAEKHLETLITGERSAGAEAEPPGDADLQIDPEPAPSEDKPTQTLANLDQRDLVPDEKNRTGSPTAEPGPAEPGSEEEDGHEGGGGQEPVRMRREPCAAAVHAYPGLDPALLQEFPPDRLPLSVPPNHSRRLSLGPEPERRGRVPSQRIEALQERLASSPGRVAKERIARMKEVDSVSRIRRLSQRSTSWDGEETAPLPQDTHNSPADVTELSHIEDV
ncbi:uncharacterized protein LOC125284642 [Alosa alosa]|uniref:uncharacterized protein LOC125284642 n=1 Tax=Alosa alosa TaxID=278164 RepID=UPI0020150EB4|nr:uncharacterized protein LOC125284642 [Alosa alosa]